MNELAIPDEESLKAGRVVVRFAGDSGDGIQLLGTEFAKSAAANEYDIITFPDFPAEIRAPVGTLFGVSAFQMQFGGPLVLTIGDQVDVLVVFNAAALKTNLEYLRDGGLIIVDLDGFTKRDLTKAGYQQSPLESGELDQFEVLAIEINRHAREAALEHGVTRKEADRTKNFWALGLIYWMFDQDREPTRAWIKSKFSGKDTLIDANTAALDGGHIYGETAELSGYSVPAAYKADFPDANYRTATGNDTLVYGLAAATVATNRSLCFCSYPITPASGILHGLSKLNFSNIKTFQAEDEIAAVCAAIGASYAGDIGVTASSGPGIALKTEAMGLAVAVELPLVVINVQRAGPSTGMPTKTEQADLGMALYGRHGEAPVIVLAPATPSECYDVACQAVKLACKYMTPVMILVDGYIANASEPWRIPDIMEMEVADHANLAIPGDEPFSPYLRDKASGARPWAVPGMAGFEHRIGGIERADGSGNISYDPDNHQLMGDLRANKILKAADDLPPADVERGAKNGRLAIVGWGSTYGAIDAAVNELLKQEIPVSHIHIRQLSPLPHGLEELLRNFDQVLVVEMNSGQLRRLLRSEYLIRAQGLNQMTGRPIRVSRIKETALIMLGAE